MLHVALAVSDAVEHIAARRGAKRISLILADLELRAGHCVEELVEATFGKLAHLVLHTALDASDIGQHVRAETPDVAAARSDDPQILLEAPPPSRARPRPPSTLAQRPNLCRSMPSSNRLTLPFSFAIPFQPFRDTRVAEPAWNLAQDFSASVHPSFCRPPAHPCARQQDRNYEVGRGCRPKQHANIHSAHADVDKIDGGEQAQRDKWRERLSVFALERARPAPRARHNITRPEILPTRSPDPFISDPNSSLASNDGATTKPAPVTTSRPAAAAVTHIV